MRNVRLFAAAADAAGTESTQVDAATVGDCCDALNAQFGAEFARVLAQCSLLINGVRHSTADATVAIPADATVDVLPPFAGG